MHSLFFYLILTLIITAIGWLWIFERQRKVKPKTKSKRSSSIKVEPKLDAGLTESSVATAEADAATTAPKQSVYDPSLIVLQVRAFPGRVYMGYELLQTLLSVGLHFGDMNLFHRYENDATEGQVMFSVAVANSAGAFPIDDMGAFRCSGLILFMRLEPKQKLMPSFDLMLDVARQLVEELGGEIYDDCEQSLNAALIRQLREKICTVETGNLYVTDMLDNLD